MTTKATLGLTIVLLMVAMILSLKNYSDKKEVLMENQSLHQQLAQATSPAQNNQGAAPASMMNDLERRLREVEDRNQTKIAQLENQLTESQIEAEEKNALNAVVEQQQKEKIEQLSPIAQKIKSAASIGKVIEANADWGFVSFSAGIDDGVAKDSLFAIRRDHFLIARVKVTTAESGRSIADVVPKSVSEGMQILAGDEIIAYPVQ